MHRIIPIDPNREPTNATLQEAVDAAAAAGGGIVEVPAATYRMRDALHLRDGVRVVGEVGSVLLKEPSVQSPLLNFCGFGLQEFIPRDPELFEVGMGVFLTDSNAGGFYTTTATIVGKQGNRCYLDRALHHDYMPFNNGTASTLFPLVEGWGIADASIENIALDGNVAETRMLNGCRGGGVFLLRCQRVSVRGVEVRHYNGDGISFQQCTDIFVRHCHVHDNKGGGLHPGSGSVRYVLEENNVHHNGGYGIFYCLRTTHSRCARNRIEWNDKAGISIGEMDTDHWIHENTIARNGEAGIEFRNPIEHGGDRVTVESNNFVNNLRLASDRSGAEILIPDNLHDVTIVNNDFETSGKAVEIGACGSRIRVTGNRINGAGLAAGDIGGPAAGLDTVPVHEVLRPGPINLPLDGALHLGIRRLSPWSEL